jgi:hypothetical protein
MKLLLGMDSWSGLGKIMNDIKRKFEDYDLDWQVKTMPLSPSKREACKKLPRREG